MDNKMKSTLKTIGKGILAGFAIGGAVAAGVAYTNESFHARTSPRYLSSKL